MDVETTLDARDVRRMGDLREALNTREASSTSWLVPFVTELRDLLGASAALAHGLRQAGPASHELSFCHFEGPLPDVRFQSLFSGFLREAGDLRWAAYNPSRPEPRQRNRLVTLPCWKVTSDEQLPMAFELLFPKLGVERMMQTRVLICEGPSLLAWVGIWRERDCDHRQRAIFTNLVPALRRRLAAERQLEQTSRLGAFDAVLDSIGKAAFVVDAHGHVREANRMGQEELRRDGRVVRDEIAAVVSASPLAHPRWESMRLHVGASFIFLVLARVSRTARLVAQIKRATDQWSLTPRQAAILEHVAEGSANRTIASIAGISERTVEAHVTALFEKAQVECRTELVAKVYTLD